MAKLDKEYREMRSCPACGICVNRFEDSDHDCRKYSEIPEEIREGKKGCDFYTTLGLETNIYNDSITKKIY